MKKPTLDIDARIDRWLGYGIDIHSRRIHLCEDIDEASCGWAIRAIDLMEDISDEEPIIVRVDSYGGGMYESLALYDRLIECKCPITTIASGKTMSAGVTIYLAGDIRACSKNATFMLHSLSSMTEGKVFEMSNDIKECNRLQNILVQIISERSGKPTSFWKKQLKYDDQYLDLVDAFELGIVNELTV